MSELTETIVKEKLKNFFDKYKRGNKGYADVSYVAINGTTIEYKVVIVHKQTLSSDGLNLFLYNTKYRLDGNFDLLQTSSEMTIHEIGDLKIDLRPVIQELAALV